MISIALLFFIFMLRTTSELIVLVTWMMHRVTVGNCGYEVTF